MKYINRERWDKAAPKIGIDETFVVFSAWYLCSCGSWAHSSGSSMNSKENYLPATLPRESTNNQILFHEEE